MINKDKKYRTKNGLEVKIYEVFNESSSSRWKVHGSYKIGDYWQLSSWTIDGEYGSGEDYNLVEISPYADFKIDDKVFVWDFNGDKLKRYFAGIDEYGNPLTWSDGVTSFSSYDNETTSWDHCEKYEGNNE